MKHLSTIALMLGLLLLAACDLPSAPDCFKRAGDTTVESRTFPVPIRHIDIEDLVEVRIFQTDGPERVDVIGPENLLAKLRTEQEGGRLQLRNDNTCNFVRDLGIRLKVDCYVNDLDRIDYNGQGDLFIVDTLQTEVFSFESLESAGDVVLRLAADSVNILCHSGLSNYNVEGSARIAGLFNQGYGRFNATDFSTQAALCRNASINAMYVNASSYLYAAITSRGDLFYAGKPADVEPVITGSGALIAVE